MRADVSVPNAGAQTPSRYPETIISDGVNGKLIRSKRERASRFHMHETRGSELYVNSVQACRLEVGPCSGKVKLEHGRQTCVTEFYLQS